MTTLFYPAVISDESVARLVDTLEPRVPEALRALNTDGPDPVERAELESTLRTLTLQARRDPKPRVDQERLPLLIFYPGGEAPRLSNSAVCEELAALGYIVATLDAPRDAPVVVYPDGEIAFPPMAEDESYITPRVADVRLLLDLLTSPEFDDPLAAVIDAERVGMFGASRGGYLSNICAVEDSRIRGAVNMDGFLWGFWTDTTGLDHFSEEFQARTRCLTTPILRLVSDQPDSEALRRRFESESADFAGPFTLIGLPSFRHGLFSSTPFLSRRTAGTRAALAAMDSGDLSRNAQVCMNLLAAFFAAVLSKGEVPQIRWPEIASNRFERASNTAVSR